MNFSQYHFIRISKQGTGEMPHEFLTRRRINASKKLLLQTLSLEVIAGMIGYHNVNIYIRAFKKLTGTTSHHFRRGIKSKMIYSHF
ncbi:helix-turn-helix domain-containing protein [Ructibacterium gallinarum]|uniref:AraC family transcriptional regulator n=1 Tax=Ructibacterium gallinarum TaxID=2779355 RepID=A0A9D5M4C5_9FIRM|nr:helix-turn-helix domain-containing protein [Ructibacterium gallinarum]MBE5040469.1 AraC family transcriptional regulator [Ructibacterium gallinarum]